MDIGWRAKTMEEVARKEQEWAEEKAILMEMSNKRLQALMAALDIIEAYGEDEGYLPSRVNRQSELLQSMGYIK